MLRLLFLVLSLIIAPVVAVTAETIKTDVSMKKHIQADQLKSWYDQKKKMIILDARSEKYFDGTLLPDAKWVPAESAEELIRAIIPSKTSLVVVYCAGIKCPASGWLYDKLTSMGYKNVYDYHEGIEDWIARGFPTTHS